MIVKSRGRRRLTLTRIIPVLIEVALVLNALPVGVTPAMPVEYRACPKRERNGKNRVRTRQDQAPPLFCPSWEHTL
jgi:hypothetical protein